MAQLTFVFALIGMTALSGIIARYIAWLPMPWIQISLGAILAVFGVTINFDPSLFLALFIPPLLFADAWRIPKREVAKLARPILSLATFLVLATVIGGGYFIHWLIPSIPLGAAFVLASVLSPTDAVAVSAVASRAPMPSKMHHLLEGESLFNDASGLVAFKVALAALITGSFSALDAGMEFVIVALGGLVIGAAAALAFSQIVRMLSARHGDTLGQSISLGMISLPFASYLLAEHFHCSGILAAVAAGMVLNFRSIYFQMSGPSQLSIGPLWSVLAFAFNGIIFILLGSQIPEIATQGIKSAQADFAMNLPTLMSNLLLITLALLAIRFLWITLGVFADNRRQKRPKSDRLRFRLIAAASVAGIRGAVTLAAVLSIPLTIDETVPFPGRDLLIFLATGVILVSLFLATFALPALLKNHGIVEDGKELEQKMARSRSGRAAIEMLSKRENDKNEASEVYEEARTRVISIYQKRMDLYGLDESAHSQTATQIDKSFRALWIKALRTEREEIYRLLRKREIGEETLNVLLEELSLKEKALS